jgi:D-glycero-D-manno-heptose 1,7-bisphosphate phosphatase
MAMNRAVFFDKDGTLVPDIPYNCDPALMQLSEGAGEALRALDQAGYLLVVVSNQSGVAQGVFPESALNGMWSRLQELCFSEEVRLESLYYCPHHPSAKIAEYRGRCACRKPASGLLRQAAADLSISLEDSWMVGDILNDVQAGRTCGTRTIFLDIGNETEWHLTPKRMPHHVVNNLSEAAAVILAVDSVHSRKLEVTV